MTQTLELREAVSPLRSATALQIGDSPATPLATQCQKVHHKNHFAHRWLAGHRL